MQNFIFLIIIHITFLTPILKKKKKVKKIRKLDSPKCEKGYYLNGITCYSCYLNCIECDGIVCTKCEKGY